MPLPRLAPRSLTRPATRHNGTHDRAHRQTTPSRTASSSPRTKRSSGSTWPRCSREEGYEVVGEAGDGQEAVELAESLKPDLVIMDVKMPRRDGIDAASEIASKRIAPIVVLTAFSQRELVERARDAGAMAYLVKPFSITDLIPAIELAVSRFSEIAALETEVATLSDRLETRKLVERAKGLLQAKQEMTEPEAFKWIQRAAMDRRTTMKRVAEVVLETLDTPKVHVPRRRRR